MRKRIEARKQKAEKRKTEASQIDEAVKVLKRQWVEFYSLVADGWPVSMLVGEVESIEQTAKISRSVDTAPALVASLHLKMSTILESMSAFEQVEAEAAALAEGVATNDVLAAFAPGPRDDLLKWHTHATAVSELSRGGPSPPGDVLTELIEEGRSIVRQAIRAETDLQAYNEVLQATIESLKRLGFYVDGRVFIDPTDPLAHVTLAATRGADRGYLSIPPSGQVESEWHGLPEASCVVHLAEYLEERAHLGFLWVARKLPRLSVPSRRMFSPGILPSEPAKETSLRHRGFDCHPHDPPPRLLAKGAKTLPRDTVGQRSRR